MRKITILLAMAILALNVNATVWRLNNTGAGTDTDFLDSIKAAIISVIPGDNIQNLVSLSTGNYSDTMSDASVCVQFESFTIISNLTIDLLVSEISCHGGNDGEMSINVLDGVSPYKYFWSNGDTTSSISGLESGTYNVSVLDNSGLMGTLTYSLDEPSKLLIYLEEPIRDVNEYNSNGEIDIIVIGGSPPYLYNWSNGSSYQDLYNVSGGAYSLTVTDNNGCVINTSYDIPKYSFSFVDTNNINSRINSNGYLHWDMMGNYGHEVPKGSGKYSLFGSAFWFGAKDSNGKLYTSCGNFGAYGKKDYWSGPISNVYDSSYLNKYNRLWELTINEIEYHKQNYSSGNYQIPEDILNWPAHGDTSKGESYYLAPFSDENYNGIYDPENGDYPIIKGDQSLFFILNDGLGEHTETGGNKLGFEVHVFAYSYYSTDTALSNTTFLDCNIYNRSNREYSDIRFGFKTDFDLGYAFDDYVGCDSVLNMFYVYNGSNYDGDGQSYAYGDNPPAQGVTFLNVPMTSFIAYNYSGVTGSPNISNDFYNYMNATWQDGYHLVIGGTGHPSDNDASNTKTNYMFSGDVVSTVGWTEEISGNYPDDRRGVGSTALFIPAGQSAKVELALTWARDTSNIASVAKLKNDVQHIQNIYDSLNQVLSISYIVQNDDCFGSGSGAVQLTVSGGQAPYFYYWSNGSITQNQTGLTKGYYFVSVTDSVGNSGSISIYVDGFAEIKYASNIVHTSGIGMNDGSINLYVNWNSFYTYNWNTGNISENLENISSGIYYLTITDTNNCFIVDTFDVKVFTPDFCETFDTNFPPENWSIFDLDQNGNTFSQFPNSYNQTSYARCTDYVEYGTANNWFISPKYYVSASASINWWHLVAGSDNANKYLVLISTTNSNPESFLDTMHVQNNSTSGEWQSNLVSLESFLGQYIYFAFVNQSYSLVGIEDFCYQNLTEIDNLEISIENYGHSCYGEQNGFIEITVNGGVAPYSYLWSNGSTNEDLISLSQGVYTVSVSDIIGNSIIEECFVVELPELSISGTITNVSSIGSADGNIELAIHGGLGPFTFLWNTGATTENLTNIMAGVYELTVTDINACSAVESFEITQPTYPDPGWDYNYSGVNHSILIPATADITINGNQIQNGDYLGVFYFDDNGDLACGGYQVYNGINTALTVWGDDTQTSDKDGFETGESFKWKVWSAADGLEYPAIATYSQGFLNQGDFAANGISGLADLTASLSQEIVLAAGWNMISTYINPFEPLMDSLFSEIAVNVELVKDNFGDVYWPAWNVNLIGIHDVGQGYQVRMINSDTLFVAGMMVLPEQTPINLPAGWNMIAYIRQTAAPIETMMQAIETEIEIVKNGSGLTFWPAWNINMIGDMIPGEGYQIKMNSQQTLTYSANTINFSKSSIQSPQSTYNHIIKNTGSNMSLMIPNPAWETKPDFGSEILIYTEFNILVGASRYFGENTAITIWGNDETCSEVDGLTNGETFTIKLRDGDSEQILTIESWLEGDGFYQKDKISIAGSILTIKNKNSVILYQNVPNPFQNQTIINYYLPIDSDIELSIYNVLGERIEVLDSGRKSNGLHSVSFSTENQSSGIYYYKLEIDGKALVKRMDVLR